jgi:hypothetical protein
MDGLTMQLINFEEARRAFQEAPAIAARVT